MKCVHLNDVDLSDSTISLTGVNAARVTNCVFSRLEHYEGNLDICASKIGRVKSDSSGTSVKIFICESEIPMSHLSAVDGEIVFTENESEKCVITSKNAQVFIQDKGLGGVYCVDTHSGDVHVKKHARDGRGESVPFYYVKTHTGNVSVTGGRETDDDNVCITDSGKVQYTLEEDEKKNSKKMKQDEQT